ncbi:trypsin-like serine protease [Planosporangium thailandense]|uniref:Trypsin-like serine protease n=1 Tax=Planosporangium thailandense TaxID=765197 RepID=A0ABX0Y515_9ACTN|nr:trypsin-like serine protease [Planosporangium thailandense]NJC72429.1 trypsin-like serine protease [Planosporangium thailandense]
MNLRATLFATALVAALTTAASPAWAITYGSPDGNTHPEVGALIVDQAYSDGSWAYCSGTLIAPTVFVTAAHCGDPGQTTARVSFASRYRAGDTLYVGRYVPDPAYNKAQSDPHDIAVVVFDKPVRGITPARLPSAGLLDRLGADGSLRTATFTSAGYGSLAPVNGPGGKTYTYTDTRNQASGSFNALTGTWLRLSQNPATGDGGTCYGDSGGPDFLGGRDSDLLVATTITGDTACRATNVDYRLDTASARQFLGRFVALP